MEKSKRFLAKYGWLFSIIVLSLPAIWALFVPGYYGASDDMHIGWLFEMDRTLRLGQFPPRFVPDLSFGFGYPLFNFVFPFPFYLAEVFHLLNFSLVDSVKAVFLVSIPLSAWFMYKFLQEFTNKWLSLAGAVVYIFTPYRSTDIYVRGALGESLAFVFLPLIALSVVKISSYSNNENAYKNLRWIGIGGLAMAALILTHNITAYMFFPFVLLLGTMNICFLLQNKLRALISIFSMILLGLLVSAYFWLPAIIDSSLMVYDTVFNFVDHFPTIKQLLIPHWGYGASVPGPYDGMSFFIGTVNLILVVFGVCLGIYYWKKFTKKQKIILTWSGLSFVVVFLIMNYRFSFLWERLPLLPYFQFPWRFLIMTTFVTPIFIICLEKVTKSVILAAFVIVATVILNAIYFKPHDFLGRLDGYYINRYIPVPKASQEYMGLQEEYLRLPRTTQKRPEKNYQLISSSEDVKKYNFINDLDASFETDSKAGFLLEYNKYNFPGWKAEIDGKETTLASGLPFGQINLWIPEGKHKVIINFTETIFKKILDTVSLSGIIICALLILKRAKFLRK